jgi:ABC-type glycerol-3-phosphate transport system permease component
MIKSFTFRKVYEQGVEGMSMRMTRIEKILPHVLMTILASFMLTPLLWMLATSFSEDTVIVTARLLPKDFTLENYAKAWNFSRVFREGVTMGTFFVNSLIMATFITTVGLFVDSSAGYVLARKDFSGRELFFYAAVATLMIPFFVVAVPMFLIIRNLRWLNSFQGLIVPFLASGFGIYMFKQYFQTIPIELEEAAKADGYSDFRIYWSIMLPLSKPALGTMAILKFMWSWNMFFWPLIILTDIGMKTLPLALTMFRGLYVTQWGLLTAGMTIAIAPPIIIYIAFQKYFTSGLMTGSIKA